jgi:hypothetical protein
MCEMLYRLVGYIALTIAGLVVIASSPAHAQNAATISNPTVSVNGSPIPIDRCYHYAQSCDDPTTGSYPSSQAYCVAHGYSVATSAQWVMMSQTYVQGDNTICNVPNGCGGVTQIICQ